MPHGDTELRKPETQSNYEKWPQSKGSRVISDFDSIIE